MATCFYCLGNHEPWQCQVRAIEKAGNRMSSAIEKSGSRSSEGMSSDSWRLGNELATMADTQREMAQDISDAMCELNESFRLAHAQTMWQMEKQTHLLTGIHDMLKNPRATQSNELYDMAVDSLRRNRLDDSLRLLSDARELNPGDYRVHITMGHILVEKGRYPEARESFRAGSDYARTDKYKKHSLLLTSRVERCMGRFREATDTLREAYSIAPDDPLICYELATAIAAKNAHSLEEG